MITILSYYGTNTDTWMSVSFYGKDIPVMQAYFRIMNIQPWPGLSLFDTWCDDALRDFGENYLWNTALKTKKLHIDNINGLLE